VGGGGEEAGAGEGVGGGVVVVGGGGGVGKLDHTKKVPNNGTDHALSTWEKKRGKKTQRGRIQREWVTAAIKLSDMGTSSYFLRQRKPRTGRKK